MANLTAFELLIDLGGEAVVSSIVRYDRESGRFETSAFENGELVGSDFVIEPQEGYILNMLKDVSGFGP